jgi:hypothetical protein
VAVSASVANENFSSWRLIMLIVNRRGVETSDASLLLGSSEGGNGVEGRKEEGRDKEGTKIEKEGRKEEEH